MHRMTLRHAIALGMAMLLLTTAATYAQMDQKFAEGRQQNAQALRQYAWKSRTEVRKGGETKTVQLAYMRYDLNGALQKTPLSATPQQQLPTHGLRGLIAQKKKEDFMETLDGLSRLAHAYGELPPDAMQRFMATAMFAPEIGPQQKLIRITGGNLLQPGDVMTIWVDAATRKQRRVEIQTSLDRKPVRIASDFQDLPQGPTYMARSVVDYPSEGLTLITENFDYEPARR